MSSFRFDVGNFNSKNEKMNLCMSKYKSLCEQAYIKAKSIKNSWNDSASNIFFEILTADEEKTNEIFSSLGEYQKNLEYFGTELSNIFSERGYATHDLVVEYNSSNVNFAYNYLDVAKRHIRNAQKAFEDCVVPADYNNMDALNEVFNALYNDIGRIADEMDRKLNDVFQRIEGLIATNKSRNVAIPFVKMNDTLYSINPSTIYMDKSFLNTEYIKRNAATDLSSSAKTVYKNTDTINYVTSSVENANVDVQTVKRDDYDINYTELQNDSTEIIDVATNEVIAKNSNKERDANDIDIVKTKTVEMENEESQIEKRNGVDDANVNTKAVELNVESDYEQIGSDEGGNKKVDVSIVQMNTESVKNKTLSDDGSDNKGKELNNSVVTVDVQSSYKGRDASGSSSIDDVVQNVDVVSTTHMNTSDFKASEINDTITSIDTQSTFRPSDKPSIKVDEIDN